MGLRLFRAILLVVATLAVVSFTLDAVRRVTDPRPVRPIEGAVLVQAERFVRGVPLYDDSARATASVPMPGYPFVSSLLARTFGVQLWVPRLLALLALLAIAGLVLTVVRLETESWTLALSAIGLLFMGYAVLAEPPGIARPDTLMLLLVVLGFLELRVSRRVAGALTAALLLAAAVFVDQRAAWFVLAGGVALAVDDVKRLPAFALLAVSIVAGGYLALSRLLGPWFNFAAWDGPVASMRLDPMGLLHYVCDHLLGKLGISTLVAVLSFALPTRPWRGKGGLWIYFGIAALASGLVATQRADFAPHDLIPGIVALAMLGPISIRRVTGHLSTWPGSTRLAGSGLVLAAVTLQMLVLLASLPIARSSRDAATSTAHAAPANETGAPLSGRP